MRLVWTRSSSPLSKLIRWITGDECSHFAFVFESRASGLMFQSNLLGTHPKFWVTEKKRFEVVHEKVLDLSIEQEDAIWELIVQKYDGKGYDFGGALFLGWCKLKQRILKSPLPTKNKWANDDKFFCDEVYDIFNHIEGVQKINVTGGMHTPHDVWEELREKHQ